MLILPAPILIHGIRTLPDGILVSDLPHLVDKTALAGHLAGGIVVLAPLLVKFIQEIPGEQVPDKLVGHIVPPLPHRVIVDLVVLQGKAAGGGFRKLLVSCMQDLIHDVLKHLGPFEIVFFNIRARLTREALAERNN